QAVRAVALLPGVTGAYARPGGGALLFTAPEFGWNYAALRRPASGPAETRLANHNRLGDTLLHLGSPRIRALFIAANNPAVTCPARLRTAGPVQLRARPCPQRFATPSGKLEFYSATLAAEKLPAMPDWEPDAVSSDEARWPLRLLSVPGYFQSHTAFSGNGFLRKREGP